MEKYKAAATIPYHGASERREHFSIVSFCGKRKIRVRGGEWESENGVTNSRQIGPAYVQSVASAFFFSWQLRGDYKLCTEEKRIRVFFFFFHCRIFGEKNKRRGEISESRNTRKPQLDNERQILVQDGAPLLIARLFIFERNSLNSW